MVDAPKMAFSHLGIFVADTWAMVNFYTSTLGFSVTDQAEIGSADLVFLSRNPEEHHQIVFVPGRKPEDPSTVNQISFRVVSLAELRKIYRRLIDESVSSLEAVNHGGSWSVYFSDPEGNRIELFAQTPWYIPPVSVPLDLDLSDDDIYQLTESMVKETPGNMMRVDWYDRMRRRMVDEGTLEDRGSG